MKPWQIMAAVIVISGIVGLLAAYALTVAIDSHMDRSRPETPIINSVEG